MIALGEKSIYGKILKEIILRDKADINRKESPLIIPRNSIIIDNSSSFKGCFLFSCSRTVFNHRLGPVLLFFKKCI